MNAARDARKTWRPLVVFAPCSSSRGTDSVFAWLQRGSGMRAAVIVPGRDGGDRDWPAVRAAFERCLDPGNFADGSQRRRLSDPRSGAG